MATSGDLNRASSHRVLRHRHTEALRRQRTKAVVKELRSLLQLKSTVDQVSVMEAALEAVQDLVHMKQQLSNGELQFVEPEKRSSTGLPQGIDIDLDMPMSSISTISFQLDSPSHSGSGDTTPDSETNCGVVDLDAAMGLLPPSQPSMACHNLGNELSLLPESLNTNLPLATAFHDRNSLSSPYIRNTVALCILDVSSMGLDCNQHALDLLRAPSLDSLDVSWDESGILCDLDLGRIAMQHLMSRQASTVTLLEELRCFDGTFKWMRTTMVRMDDNADVLDPASVACSFQPTILVVSQPAEAPLDGRGRAWADTSLLHMSTTTLPRSVAW
eukprot:m.31062 g.31062  ORF g.31062 m.31062 type:complete len:330 (-) comp12028_c0_seq1:95-1084(-)